MHHPVFATNNNAIRPIPPYGLIVILLNPLLKVYITGDLALTDVPSHTHIRIHISPFHLFFPGTDPEDVIKNAFGCFDDDNNGILHEERLRELLTTIGDRFTDEEVDEMYREAPIKNGMFDYIEFTRILKHGAKEKDEA